LLNWLLLLQDSIECLRVSLFVCGSAFAAFAHINVCWRIALALVAAGPLLPFPVGEADSRDFLGFFARFLLPRLDLVEVQAVQMLGLLLASL
jgi:hypothetical protein